MDRVVDIMVTAMEGGRIDVLTHPTCLPKCLMPDCNELFNLARCDKIIEAAIVNNVALEINNLFKAPDLEFVDKAMRAGARFSLGSDGHSQESVCDLSYPLKIVKEARISEKYIFNC